MARWSRLKEGSGSALDHVEIPKTCQTNACCLDPDHAAQVDGDVDESGDHGDKRRRLFDLVLSGFLKEIASRGCIRPIPAMLGDDGSSVDLFKLFLLVYEIGGYDAVTKEGLWSSVVEELGLGFEVSASVKLIYSKYLNGLEKRLREGFRDRTLENGEENECGGTFRFTSLELEKEFRGLFANWDGQKISEHGVTPLRCKKNEKCTCKGIEENKFYSSDSIGTCRKHDGTGKRFCDDDEKPCKKVAKEELRSRKRKREPLLGMLNWMTQIAKCPDDPSVGAIPGPSKWKDHGGNEFWIQVMRVRKSLNSRNPVPSIAEQSQFQVTQRMHPSMYKDNFRSHRFRDKLRCGGRLPAPVTTPSSCNSYSASQNKSTNPTELENCPQENSSVIVDLSSSNTKADQSKKKVVKEDVPVGPRFQAEVPDWNGVISDSDSKWLGIREWPIVNGVHDSLTEMDSIGRGRSDSCSCQLPGSVECVRFHIAEKRMKLKVQLGSVFYRWQFDLMGEEVSLRWTFEEENRFKDIVKSNSHSSYACFWADACNSFPRKTREDLISYYFNVFRIQLRSYQNRVTPKQIDSDNDEPEFGCIAGSFGNEALKIPGRSKSVCYESKQPTDLKEMNSDEDLPV